eukprot:4065222-Prymnesium_polylepis.1
MWTGGVVCVCGAEHIICASFGSRETLGRAGHRGSRPNGAPRPSRAALAQSTHRARESSLGVPEPSVQGCQDCQQGCFCPDSMQGHGDWIFSLIRVIWGLSKWGGGVNA